MNIFPKCRLLKSFYFLSALAIIFSLSVAAAQEGQEQPSVSQDDIEQYEELKELAKEQRIDAAVQENKTGTDPRDFSLKWMPFYRYTNLENGLTQQDLTAFGTVPFTPDLGCSLRCRLPSIVISTMCQESPRAPMRLA